ncbi:hypothetical protein QYF51_24525, partial [Paenibacillus polymyxa]|nr:hypothetical protein [Paenibacillus polymyxa]
KEQEKARAEAALKAEKEARAKALKAKKEAAPPELTDEEYEKIQRDYVYWSSLENRRPEIPLGSYRAEDGVVRTANGNPDFKYYDDWKQNYQGDFLILSNQEGITPEEQRWMSHANIFAEPVPLDGRGGEGRALKNEFSKMSKEGALENARLARENVRRIQQRIDQKSITTKNASEPFKNTPETVPSKPKWWHAGYVDDLTDSQIILGVKQSPKGLSTLGSSTRSEAMSAGKAWVGEKAESIIDKTTGEIIGFKSADGMRAFRIQFKPGENMVRANFQENTMIRTERNYNDYNKTWAPKQIRNVHIDILE